MAHDRRGEVWLVDLGYAAKTRPALVVSVPSLDTERALVLLVPHTTSPRGTRFEVASQQRFLKTGVFDTQNLVTVPEAKLLRRIGRLSSQTLNDVTNALLAWLGLSTSPQR
jgi:mRNA interferase MazF